MIAAVFVKVIMIFGIIAIGIAASKTGLVSEKATPYLNDLLLNVVTPLMLVGTLGSQKLTPSLLHETIQALLGTAFLILLFCVIAIALVKPLHFEPAEDRGVLMALMTSSNVGFMGFPITLSLFGRKIFYLMVVTNVIQVFYFFGLIPFQLSYGQKSDLSFKQVLRMTFSSAPIIGALVGCVILFAQIPLPKPLLDMLNSMGSMNVPLSMFIVGMQLSQSHPLKLLKNYKLLITCLINVLLVPALAYLVTAFLPVTQDVRLELVVAFIFPAAVICSALAQKLGKNYVLTAEGITLSTLLSLITIPLWGVFLTARLV